MSTKQNTPRTRTIGFRLTATEYTQLEALAERKSRRIAELVRLIVVRALKVQTEKADDSGEAGQ
jgi:hypothetical protein